MKNLFLLANILFISILTSITAFAQDKPKKIQSSEIKVEGVCMMCKERIEDAALIKGVKLAQWDQKTQMLKIIYKAKNVSPLEVEKALARVGHDTEHAKAKDENYQKLPDCCKYRDGVESH